MTSPLQDVPLPASQEAAAKAAVALDRFPECFWFRNREAPLQTVSDILLVVRRLRQYGRRTAWEYALEDRAESVVGQRGFHMSVTFVSRG